jgi:hypothetical protein
MPTTWNDRSERTVEGYGRARKLTIRVYPDAGFRRITETLPFLNASSRAQPRSYIPRRARMKNLSNGSAGADRRPLIAAALRSRRLLASFRSLTGHTLGLGTGIDFG